MDCVSNRHLSVGMFKKLLVCFVFLFRLILFCFCSVDQFVSQIKHVCDKNENDGSFVAREGSGVRLGRDTAVQSSLSFSSSLSLSLYLCLALSLWDVYILCSLPVPSRVFMHRIRHLRRCRSQNEASSVYSSHTYTHTQAHTNATHIHTHPTSCMCRMSSKSLACVIQHGDSFRPCPVQPFQPTSSK